MSNKRKNCWIEWNSAALCMNVCPICSGLSYIATILCVWEIIGLVYMLTGNTYQKGLLNKKARHHTEKYAVSGHRSASKSVR